MLVDELVQKITIKADTKALDTVQRKEKQLIATTNTLGASLKSAFILVGGTLLFKSIVDASVSLDGLNRSFNAIAGSSAEGAKQVAFLRKEAMRLGQDFPTIANAYKNFFAVGQGAGMATGETQSIFTSVLEASTVLGSSTQSVEGALLAIEQMISKGKVSMEELRRQLGNALPGAMQIASKAIGVTTAELEKLISKGIPSTDFVRKFSKELNKRFSGKALTEPVKSLRAELTRLKNAWYFLRSDLFDGEAGKAFAEALREITKLLMSDGFRKALKMISSALTFIFKNFKLIASTVIFRKFLLLITGAKQLGVALRFISRFGGFNTLIKSTKALSVAGWGAVLPFAKLALMIVAIHDLIVALFDKDLSEKYQKWIEKHPFLSRITNPGVLLGEMSAGVVQAFQHNPNNQVPFPQNIQQPQVVQTNNIYTQNIDQNMLDERIKGQVRNLFSQTRFAGVK